MLVPKCRYDFELAVPTANVIQGHFIHLTFSAAEPTLRRRKRVPVEIRGATY